ncbi:MAG TPA: PEGA domain-containing protein [Polyangiaceae bacterium]|nr:PEGA domain-containing protein [Polyangiaceae bacterium]
MLRVLLRWLATLATLFLMAQPVKAEPTEDGAKRHFTNGVHLFEDRNFAGALVEFEQSFRLNPTAAAMQNIAVCQKGLFRYGEAIATLERMLREFASQLSPDDKKAADDAIRDMSALLGTVVMRVGPADARVSINDAPLSTEAMKSPVKLAAGEYRVVVEAPGYARQERVIRVVSGQKDVPVQVQLSPLSGTLVVRAHDSEAAIALDGVQVGYEEWKGPVSAGPHEIYVYTQTLRRKSTVTAYAGQITEFDAKLTPEDAIPSGQPALAAGLPVYVPPSQRGIFAFLLFGGASVGSAPPAELHQNKDRAGGPVGGIAVGYRFSTALAAEFDAESASYVIGACGARAERGCSQAEGNYDLRSSRVGPAIRLMTSGAKGRFVGTIGLGAVVHTLSYDQALRNAVPSAKLPESESAVGSYLKLSGAYELSFGHFLLDLGLVIVGETADEKVGIKNTGSLGLEFRAGYGQW